MALNHNIVPSTSMVFAARDFAPQLEANQRREREGLQGAFKFVTQIYDYLKQRGVADAIDEGNIKEAAVLDAQRINNQDPTSIFRWKTSQDQAKAIHDENLAAQKAQREADLERVKAEKDNAKATALQNLKYKIDAQLKPMSVGMNTTQGDIKMWNDTLANLEEQGLSGDVGEDYMKKIWDRQSALKNAKLPAEQAAQMNADFDTLMDNYDKIPAHGGYGKNREAYLKDVDANWAKLKELYEVNGAEIPLEYRKKYIEARNKFNTTVKTKKKGVLSKV